MTTIAFDGEMIAYDGRVTQGSKIVCDDYDKKYERNGVLFFLSGDLEHIEPVISSYFDKQMVDGLNCEGFVYDDGKLYEIVAYDRGISVNENIGPIAYGSGSDHAITAIDCGLNAKEAVKMAAKRDIYTGGKIRTFKINWRN